MSRTPRMGSQKIRGIVEITEAAFLSPNCEQILLLELEMLQQELLGLRAQMLANDGFDRSEEELKPEAKRE